MTIGREKTHFRSGRVLFGSPYVPREWIEGHGLGAVEILPPATSPTEDAAGVCPYARLMLNAVESQPQDAVIFTTRCDQTRRISELFKGQREQSFLMNIPTTWQSQVAWDMYRDELLRLSRFLISLGGKAFSPQRISPSTDSEPTAGAGTKIAVFGGPETARVPEFHDLLRLNGLRIALDGTELSGLGRGDIDMMDLETDPLTALTRACFVDLPDIAKRPNTQFYSFMSQCLKERGIEGIIVRTFPWCDLWAAELPRIRECFKLPVLHYVVDLTTALSSDKRLKTRLSAFAEMIQ